MKQKIDDLIKENEELRNLLAYEKRLVEEKTRAFEMYVQSLKRKTTKDTFFVNLDKYNKLPSKSINISYSENDLVYLANIIRDSNDALIITDFNGYILAWNNIANEIYGYSKNKKVNNYLDNMTSDEEKAEIAEIFKKLYLQDNIKSLDSRRINKHHMVIDVDFNFNLLKDVSENPVAVTILEHDITERKKFEFDLIAAKEKAIESSHLKSILITNLNHELRTPLNEIIGFSKILKYDTKDPEIIEVAEYISRSSKRLFNTLESIITLSRAEAHLIDLKLEQVYLVNNIYEVLNDFIPMAREKNLTLEVDRKDKTIFAILDERLFFQSMSYIVENAIKFTDQGKVTIDLETETVGDELFALIKIRDTGIGIKKEMFEVIFEEFRQIDEKLSRSYEGVGLGLTLARNMVKMMKGSIKVESEFGVGSTFTIRYPAFKIM